MAREVIVVERQVVGLEPFGDATRTFELRYEMLGVVRQSEGADLLLYALVIAFLSYIAMSYRRLSELERKLPLLARELALTRARQEEQDHSS